MISKVPGEDGRGRGRRWAGKARGGTPLMSASTIAKVTGRRETAGGGLGV